MHTNLKYIHISNYRNKLEKKPIISKTFLPSTNSNNNHTSSTTVTVLPLMYSASPPLVQRDISQHHHQQQHHTYDAIHHKDELDAAEALANLAFNCRQKMLDTATNGRNSLSWPLNTVSS